MNKKEVLLALLDSPELPSAAERHEGDIRAGLAYLAWRADGSHIGDDPSRRMSGPDGWLAAADAIPGELMEGLIAASEERMAAYIKQEAAMAPARDYFAALTHGGGKWKEEWSDQMPPAAAAVLAAYGIK